MNNAIIFFWGLALLASGCMSTRQIQTSSPRPMNAPEQTEEGAAGMGLLSIDVLTGSTTLPDDIQALRFRIDEIRLHSEAGEWVAFPAELNSFEILPNRAVGKTILTTRVQPVPYDSLALRMSDVFVLFGENAGAPLTLPRRDTFLFVALRTLPSVGRALQIRLAFEPGASLMKDAACRWHFVPFWTATVD